MGLHSRILQRGALYAHVGRACPAIGHREGFSGPPVRWLRSVRPLGPPLPARAACSPRRWPCPPERAPSRPAAGGAASSEVLRLPERDLLPPTGRHRPTRATAASPPRVEPGERGPARAASGTRLSVGLLSRAITIVNCWAARDAKWADGYVVPSPRGWCPGTRWPPRGCPSRHSTCSTSGSRSTWSSGRRPPRLI